MKKRIISALSVLLMLCALAMNVSAISIPDMSRTGSISITMTYQGESVPGGSLTIYQVAEVHLENDADYSFRYTEAYAACDVLLEDLASAQTAQALESYTREQNIAGTKVQIDDKGHISFEELPLGLYLLVQEDPAEGYSLANPFLVSVPGMENGSYVYEVDASPKLALEQEPTEPTEPSDPTEPTGPSNIPQTGQMNWPVPIFAVVGLALVALGWYLHSSGKKRYHES